MEDSAEGDANDSSSTDAIKAIDIAPKGDAVLDVTFETSKETLRATRKATQPRPGQKSAPPRPLLQSTIRRAYRIDVVTLKKQSKYFDNLLGDTRFEEARTVIEALKALSLRNERLEDLDATDLPWVKIVNDDEATRSAGRENVFADLLRILHGKEAEVKPPTMSYVTNLAVLADQYMCTGPVSRYLNTGLKFKWPVTQSRTPREGGLRITTGTEEAIRQKILTSWLLDQPTKLHAATRELILYGSHQWDSYAEPDESRGATWWDLQDDLDSELQCRRECVLKTIASVQQHFLSLYTSRTRQCKLGYDSSAACDSYQLGEMIRFLTQKDLLFLVDFSSSSLESVKDYSLLEIAHILATLKQVPSYQIDKNHTNCGLRTRILPILDYIQTMMSSNILSISRRQWKDNRASTSWLPSDDEQSSDHGQKIFRFTRSVAGDQRLRFEGAMAADRLARDLFTAKQWDWTPDDEISNPSRGSSTAPTFSFYSR